MAITKGGNHPTARTGSRPLVKWDKSRHVTTELFPSFGIECLGIFPKVVPQPMSSPSGKDHNISRSNKYWRLTIHPTTARHDGIFVCHACVEHHGREKSHDCGSKAVSGYHLRKRKVRFEIFYLHGARSGHTPVNPTDST